MKEILTRNISLKILSILLAALLWLVITNVDDPVITRSFSKVPVKILNEDLVKKSDQEYEITEGENISFRVAGRRSVIDRLNLESDFSVTADFEDLSNVNSVIINISCNKNGVNITDGKYQTLKITLEKLTQENFKVNIIQKGEVSEGYYVGDKTANPNIITVSGPKSRIDRIKQIAVDVDVTGAARSFSKIAEPKALDAEGNIIDSSRLTFSEKYITVNMEMYKTKTINIQVNTRGVPADGYVVTNVEYKPETVTIAGEDKILSQVNYLPVPIDISGKTENIETEVELRDCLSEGTMLVDEEQTDAVKITIEKLVTKEITIWPNDIQLRNMDDNLRATFITVGPIILKVRGPGKEMEKVDKSTLNPYVDLINYTAGTFTLSIKIDYSDKVKLTDTSMVSLVLSQ